jgi:hypothetical protein
MSAKPLRAAVPKNLLSYLNSFENDRNHYIPDPSDERQIIVANQKIFSVSGEGLADRPLNIGDRIRVVPTEARLSKSIEEREYESEEIVVIGQSIWRPNLVLLQGANLHSGEKNHNWETPAGDLTFEVVGSNVVTTTSPAGTQAHDPTRTSDGSSRHKGGISGDDESNSVTDSCTPLTEYWLRKAAAHNAEHVKAPVVAILDTGIDFQFDWTMSTLPEPDCPLWFNNEDNTRNDRGQGPLQKDMIGWNFVGSSSMLVPAQHNNPFDDDENHKHGTRIAAILAQQCRAYKETGSEDCNQGTNVRLMILKTHDYRGVGLLFDIFCAFEYILTRNDVNIINASWGFYGVDFPALHDYMTAFKRRKIWFVTAAGNNNDFNDHFRVHELAKKSSTEHYPACYSEEFDNVLTVTTALTNKRTDSNTGSPYFEIQPSENYSNRFVDVAITAGKDGCFPEPLRRVNHVIKGTSYATAYAIGKMVRSGLPESKAEFLNPANSFISENESLKKYVKNGCFITSDIDVEKEQF